MSIIDINKRLTRYQKEKNNFSAIKDKVDAYDLWLGSYRDAKRKKNFEINYGLFNGKLDLDLYDDPLCFQIGKEMVSFDHMNLSHYPLISQIANAIVGEQAERPFKPMVKDNTADRRTLQTKETNERVKNYINGTVIQPEKQRITKELSEKFGITDIFSLNPEEQVEFSNAVNQQVMQQTPKETMEFLKHDFQTPTAKQAQKTLDFLVEYHEIYHKQVEGFKHAVITGEEYYYEGSRNGKLVFEVIPPMNFRWGGSRSEEWSQNSTFCRYEDWYTIEDAIQRNFTYLEKKDLKDLEFGQEPIGGMRDGFEFTDWEKNHAQKELMYRYSSDDGLFEKYKGIDIKTKKGQKRMTHLYADVFGEKSGNDLCQFGVREAHIMWRDKRILQQVHRTEKDRKVKYWVDEHYVPRDEDDKITKHWIDEVWEATKLGTFHPKYVKMQPLAHQYTCFNNPGRPEFPYYGKKLNTHNNTVKNCSIIDLGKTLQKDFDIIMGQIKHDIATSFGQTFLFFLQLKPENHKWSDWFDTMRNSGLMLADSSKMGMNGFDAQFAKEVNISKLSDAGFKLQLAESYRVMLARTMYFNDARLGEIGQYQNQRNTQANESASYKQTSLLFAQHNLIVEKAMRSFLNRARNHYKDNPSEAKVFLDDVSLAELMSGPRTSYQQMGITLSNSPAEIRKLEVLKQQTLNFIQNPTSLSEGIIELIYADTENEIRDVVKKQTEVFKQERQEQIEAAQQQQQAQIQGELQKEQLVQDREDARLDKKLQAGIMESQIETMRFAHQQDINKDGQNDLIEKTLIELQAKLKMHRDDIDIEREKLALKEKLGKSN